MSTTLVCVCGLAGAQHGPGLTDHPPVYEQWAQGLRDTQRLKLGIRPGHYSIKEQRIFVGAKPAAGVDIKASVPQAGRWKVWGLTASLTTSAVVANRVPHLQITDGPAGDVAYDVPSAQNQIATQTVKYSGVASGVAQSFDNTNVLVLPVEIDLLGNWTVGFKTTALDVGDQWTALTLLVTETLYF